MTLAPDHTGYTTRGETSDPWFEHLVSTATDYTHPGDITSRKDAENLVLKHIQEWWADDDADLAVAYCCLVADLGRRVPEKGFTELADEYREPMTPSEADTWTQNLTNYIRDNLES